MVNTKRPGPTILWLRRDLRLGDHPGWTVAVEAGPVIPVFIRDPLFDEMTGAAATWRMGRALETLGQTLVSRGSALILRTGEAQDCLADLIRETGATRVVWSRAYDSRSIARDTHIKTWLRGIEVEPVSVNAHLLHEPWTVETGTGGYYKVYTPFWKAVRGRDVPSALPEPSDLCPPNLWPRSENLETWQMGLALHRGAAILERHVCVGERAAHDRLERFIEGSIHRYASGRDFMGQTATSRLSENLTYGEISPRQAWHAGFQATVTHGAEAETFLKELVWREFAYHLLYHTPRIETENWRAEWNSFPWLGENAGAERWKRGISGIEIIDAAMRELYVTGYMHNRTRMLTASLLTKHLMTHWTIGEAWFRDCLVDWDVAANAMGWQWAAGCGPDAAPYFRVFNPATQAEKFDPDRAYRDRWLAEGRSDPHADALSYFEAVPKSWGLSVDDPYPAPVVDLAVGRQRALDAYAARKGAA